MSDKNLGEIAEILDIPAADLFFSPASNPRTPAADRAAAILGNLSSEDTRKWLSFGEALRSTCLGKGPNL